MLPAGSTGTCSYIQLQIPERKGFFSQSQLQATLVLTLNSGRGVCVAGMGCSLQVIVCQVMRLGVVSWVLWVAGAFGVGRGARGGWDAVVLCCDHGWPTAMRP
jgi:hypothetical protein